MSSGEGIAQLEMKNEFKYQITILSPFGQKMRTSSRKPLSGLQRKQIRLKSRTRFFMSKDTKIPENNGHRETIAKGVRSLDFLSPGSTAMLAISITKNAQDIRKY